MGWFGFWSDGAAAKHDDRPVGKDGYKAPDRTERALCWEARDAFFACLDKHGVVDAIRDDAKAREACGVALRDFDRDCAGSWVTYFKKRRVMEHQKEMTIKRLKDQGTDVEMTTPGSVN